MVRRTHALSLYWVGSIISFFGLEFMEGFKGGDVDRIMSFYADQSVDVNMAHPAQSRAERREYYRKIMDRRDTEVAVTPEEIIVNREHAFVWGILLKRRDGTAPPKELCYIEIARKFPDGWRAIGRMDAEMYPETK